MRTQTCTHAHPHRRGLRRPHQIPSLPLAPTFARGGGGGGGGGGSFLLEHAQARAASGGGGPIPTEAEIEVGGGGSPLFFQEDLAGLV